MKIGDSVTNYYRPQIQTSGSATASPSESGIPRTQPPTISIGGLSTSNALSSALWLSMSEKSEDADGALAGARNKAVADEFMEWSEMSPAEKIRAQILEKKELTEEELAAMDPNERAAIEAEIKAAIERQLGIEDGGTASTETGDAVTA